MRKLLFTAAALSIMITQTGCFGTFALTKKIYDFNDGISDSGVLKTLFFYLLVIVPVYGISLIVDAVIFNLIEFWGGSNPISMEAGELEEQLITKNGKVYKITATQNKMSFAELVNGKLVDMGELVYSDEKRTWNFEKDGLSEELISINGGNSVDFNTLAGTQTMEMSDVDCLAIRDFSNANKLELASN